MNYYLLIKTEMLYTKKKHKNKLYLAELVCNYRILNRCLHYIYRVGRSVLWPLS